MMTRKKRPKLPVVILAILAVCVTLSAADTLQAFTPPPLPGEEGSGETEEAPPPPPTVQEEHKDEPAPSPEPKPSPKPAPKPQKPKISAEEAFD
ncbi:MAG: hypothetical protein ACLFN0_10300, partial [Thermovirgaceae bacterium]